MADDTRQTRMTIDLGGEQVDLENVRCIEALGKPFTLLINVIAQLGELDLLPHLGKPVVITIYRDEELQRHFHGLITDGELMHESPAGLHYRLVARPFTYFMSHNRDMAIFQDLSVPAIISKVMNAAGHTNFEMKLSKTYTPRVYCVQYRESDFQFLTRLMEEEGIYYFFEHSADKHQMVFCDAPTSHVSGEPEMLTYNPLAENVAYEGSEQRGAEKEHISLWIERVSSTAETTVTLRAFDLEKPERPVQAQAVEPDKHPLDVREVYDYPAPFVDESRGQQLSAARLHSLRHTRQVYTGRTQATSLACGTKLAVTKHPTSRLNQTYVITRTEHVTRNESYLARGDTPFHQAETFVVVEAILADVQFQMPQVTPKPVVQGLETAIVSGPQGEEIYTDEYGRVKVRFHWDRADTTGENSSCWIRVAQFGNLGSVILPRVNQEVMVDFLSGDPDNPIVMGWVFNKGIMPIYDLPANKTKALWRTKRYGDTGDYPHAKSLDTGAPGANELRFEDKGGSEEVFLHAERDMKTRIRFQESHHVGQNQALMVGYDRTDDVGNDETTTIGNDQKLTVTGKQTEEIKVDRDITVDNNDKLTVKQALTIDVGTDLKITATKSITLECGTIKLVLSSLDGSMKVNGEMLSMESITESKISSPLTTIAGNGVMTVQGGVVKINC